MNILHQEIQKRYSIYHGDCCEVIKGIPDNSIDYSIFSPPFSSLYTYSNYLEDMGNSKNDDEFYTHFRFLVSELARVIKPGRNISIHCMDIPAMKERDGYIGLKDFPGDMIRLFEEYGFIYHSRVTIWKDPLIEATRTKAIGLMHKQLMKDSSMCRNGLPDYLITMRKPGNNPEPITHKDGLTQFYGKNEPNAPKRAATLKNSEIHKNISMSRLDPTYSHHTWRKYASPVWMDIDQSNTLNRQQARDKDDERHIAPLQLDVIARGVELWSNPEDIVLSPFMGIGSEGYQSVKMGRKYIGIELKDSYYAQAVKNIERAVYESQSSTLF